MNPSPSAILPTDHAISCENRYLVFALGSECYAIPVEFVIEIVSWEAPTPIPEVPLFVIGVINLRGRVVPVIDARLRFGIDPVDYNDRTCIVVVQSEEILLGMIVDTVRDVRDIPANLIEPPPRIGDTGVNRFIRGLAKLEEDITVILDSGALLTPEYTGAAQLPHD